MAVLNGDSSNNYIVGTIGDDTLNGNGGIDTLEADLGNDTLNGGLDNDYLYGGDGNDVLNGDEGKDQLNGEAGDDILYGGEGDFEYLYGGTGNDTLYGGDSYYDILYGEEGNDLLNGGLGDEDRMYGGQGADIYQFGLGYGRDKASDSDYSYNGTEINIIQLLADIAVNDVRLTRINQDLQLSVVGTNDSLTLESYFYVNSNNTTPNQAFNIQFADGTTWDKAAIQVNLEALATTGTESSDTLIGDAGDNNLNGLAGNDYLYGGDGNDVLNGDEGKDQLNGEAGDDILYGGEGDFEYLYGGTGNDTLYGGDSYYDILYGEEGNDLLNGGLGDEDRMYGGQGADIYQFGLGYGRDKASDSDYSYNGTEINIIQLLADIAVNDVRLTRINQDLQLSVVGTNDSLTLESYFYVNSNNTTPNQAFNIQFADGTTWDKAAIRAKVLETAIIGTEFNDELSGTANNDYIASLVGDDVLNGEGGIDTLEADLGNDTLNGGLDNDYLYGGDGNDVLNGDEGKDQLNGEAGDDILYGGEGDFEYLYGGTGNDTLYGGDSYYDILYGEEGNDLLNGGLGDEDRMYGGQGADIYQFGLGYGRDKASDSDYSYNGTEINIIQLLADIAVNDVRLTRINQDLQLSVVGTNDSLTLESYFYVNSNNTTPNQAFNIQFADGTTWDKTAIRNKVLETAITGTAGNDTLTGGNTNDYISGGAGNDSIDAGAGNDLIEGGTGADTLNGGDGDDTYIADGTDTINETPDGGTDTIQTPDDITLPDNVENLNQTGTGNTTGTGNNLDNTMTGNTGNNQLDGTAGNDTLMGGTGADTLTGGLGDDSLIGGAGADTFIYRYGGDGRDYVDMVSDLDQTSIDRLYILNVPQSAGTNPFMAHAISYVLNAHDTHDAVNLLIQIANDASQTIEVANFAQSDGMGGWLLNQAIIHDEIVFYADDGVTEVSRVTVQQVYDAYFSQQNHAPAQTEALAILANGIEDTTYTLFASDLLQGYTDANGDVLSIINLQTTHGVLSDNQNGTYSFSFDANFNGTVNLSYQVSDGRGGVVEATNSFMVDAVNDLPTISNIIGEMSEDDHNITGGVASDDVEGDALSYHLLGDAPDGVSFNNNGALTVTPLASDQALAQGQTRVITLQYVANDGQADSLPATIQITINGVNDAPTQTGTAASLVSGQKNSPYIVSANNLLQGFSDVDGDTLTIANLMADHATVLNNNNGTYTLSLESNYQGVVVLNYQVVDGQGGSLAATQSFNVIVVNNTTGTTGADILQGGQTDDTYIVNHVRDVVLEADANGGIDTVQSSLSYNLGNNLENLVLGGSGNLSGTGNNLDNILTGNDGNNRLLAGLGNDTLVGGAGGDTLNGGEGADVMYGGTGNDTFTIENANDLVVEFANEGYDTVNSFITYTLTANVERLNLENAGGQIDGFGNDLDNTLNGNNFANYLVGGAGNDVLQGKAGADTLEGGLGDDVYYVDNLGDVVTELANQGIDKVNSTVSYTLTANVEQLFLTGIAALSGIGNAENNIIYGNNGNNQLSGGTGNDSLNGGLGNDTLEGGAGNDTLVGGLGNDIYIFGINSGRDVIDNKDSAGNDLLLLDAGITAEQVWLRQTGNDLEVSIIGTVNSIKVKDWYGTDATSQIDSVQLADGRNLLANEVQTLVAAMAAFVLPPLGQTTLTAEQQNVLEAVITVSW